MLADDDEFDELDNDDEEEEDTDLDDDDDVEDDEELTDVGGDTIVGVSGEYDVEALFSKLDSTDPNEVARRRAIRKRIEEIRELREADLDSTFNFNLDDDP